VQTIPRYLFNFVIT